jgi:hypothetical protein
MANSPKVEVSKEDVIALALFAQRSPNAEFRENAFALALSALGSSAPPLTKLRPLSEFAARSKAKGASAERARETALRLLRDSGHADLWSQLARSAKQG